MTGLNFITKQLLDDCAMNLQEHVRRKLCGDDHPAPPRPEPVQPAVSPFPDAAAALAELLKGGFEIRVGEYGDLECFYCGAELEYHPHSADCAYLRALETK